MIVDGQVQGGVAQGIGAALYEEIVYDDTGQLLTVTLADYLIPTLSEVPKIDTVHLDAESPSTVGGFRGMGEGGTIGAPAAVANAVADAHAEKIAYRDRQRAVAPATSCAAPATSPDTCRSRASRLATRLRSFCRTRSSGSKAVSRRSGPERSLCPSATTPACRRSPIPGRCGLSHDPHY